MTWNRDTLETRAAEIAGRSMQHASWTACRRTGWWLGLLLFKALKKRRAVAIANVQRAFPELGEAAARQIARRSVQNAAMTLFEFTRLGTATPAEVRDYVGIDGFEHIHAGLEKGKGVILLTAHLGNWELLGTRAAQEFPISVVARPTSNAGLQEQISRVRAHGGIEVFSKHDTGRAALETLRNNRALAILPDQYAGPDGMILPFFGHRTRVVSSVARLSMLSGAPIVPVFGVRRRPWLNNGRIEAHVTPGYFVENDRKRREELVRTGTERMISDLENIITLYPDQWLWLHRRWRDEDLREDLSAE
jgi:Kdo2-lipid IVA lauroyltransferase/acyltransferase